MTRLLTLQVRVASQDNPGRVDYAAAPGPGGLVGVARDVSRAGLLSDVGRAGLLSGDPPLVSCGAEVAGPGTSGATGSQPGQGTQGSGMVGDGGLGALPHSSAQQQELFIRRKYHERAFVRASALSPAQLNEALHKAVKGGDVVGMLEMLAQNADVNREAEDEVGITPLMQVCPC